MLKLLELQPKLNQAIQRVIFLWTKKLNKEQHIVYSLHGDGELQEGQNWEAIMYASANKIDNIICTIDNNSKQIDGDLKDVLDMGCLKTNLRHLDGLY